MVIDRGKLKEIAGKELSNINCKLLLIGRHKVGKISAGLHENILRLLKLLKQKPDSSVGNGFLHGMVSKLFEF